MVTCDIQKGLWLCRCKLLHLHQLPTMSQRPMDRQYLIRNQNIKISRFFFIKGLITTKMHDIVIENGCTEPRFPFLSFNLAFGGAHLAQCARSATIWASGRTRDPYFEILGAPLGASW